MVTKKMRSHRKKKNVHLAPGTLNVDPTLRKPTVRLLLYDEHDYREYDAPTMAELAAAKSSGQVAWIHIDGLGEQSILEQTRDQFLLHRLAMEDVVNLHQRPKAEDYDHHLFVIIQVPSLHDTCVHTEQLSLFLGDHWVITFEENPPDVFDPVRERIRTRKGIVRDNKADYLTYALIDCVLDCYFPILETFCDRMETLEEQILHGTKAKHAAEVHRVKQELLTIRRALWPTREMLTMLLRNERGRFGPTALLHLRDCLDHANQLLDLVEVYRELANDLMSLHLMNAGVRQNEVMKLLTIVSAIFIPLGFIAGVYGMNFDRDASPLNMPELGWYHGYPAALALMAIVALAMLAFIWHKGWLSKD